MNMEFQADRSLPIGMFDSGLGGLSVLKHVHNLLPHENVLYFSDAAFAPYGDKTEEAVASRSIAVTNFLINQGIKALVVACNTATASVIHILRERYPSMPIIGIEPGLKPAANLTKTGVVGVLATSRTLQSERFAVLCDQLQKTSNVNFVLQPCPGLADQIEKGELISQETRILLKRYIAPLLDVEADVLVLGCTHYPFVREAIDGICKSITTRPVGLIDTGLPVAKRLQQILMQRGLASGQLQLGSTTGLTSGEPSIFKNAYRHLLRQNCTVEKITA